jgi:ATP-dependent RNA helicase DOB1
MLIVCVIFIQGATFAEVMEMTDIFEGSVIRLARRLDEFLNQVDCHLYPSFNISVYCFPHF